MKKQVTIFMAGVLLGLSPMLLGAGEVFMRNMVKIVGSDGATVASTSNPISVSTQSFSFGNVTTNTTTTLKSGAGVLRSIVVNGLGTGSTATIYDNTSATGTLIGTVNTALSILPINYDVAFSTGLTVVTAGAVSANITVVYK